MKRLVKVFAPCPECEQQRLQNGGTQNEFNAPTQSKCSGSNFGGPNCPPGSQAYEMAKAFRKISNENKKAFSNSAAPMNQDINSFGQQRLGALKGYIADNTREAMLEDLMVTGEIFQYGGISGDMAGFGYDPSRAQLQPYIDNMQANAQNMKAVGAGALNAWNRSRNMFLPDQLQLQFNQNLLTNEQKTMIDEYNKNKTDANFEKLMKEGNFGMAAGQSYFQSGGGNDDASAQLKAWYAQKKKERILQKYPWLQNPPSSPSPFSTYMAPRNSMPKDNTQYKPNHVQPANKQQQNTQQNAQQTNIPQNTQQNTQQKTVTSATDVQAATSGKTAKTAKQTSTSTQSTTQQTPTNSTQANIQQNQQAIIQGNVTDEEVNTQTTSGNSTTDNTTKTNIPQGPQTYMSDEYMTTRRAFLPGNRLKTYRRTYSLVPGSNIQGTQQQGNGVVHPVGSIGEGFSGQQIFVPKTNPTDNMSQPIDAPTPIIGNVDDQTMVAAYGGNVPQFAFGSDFNWGALMPNTEFQKAWGVSKDGRPEYMQEGIIRERDKDAMHAATIGSKYDIAATIGNMINEPDYRAELERRTQAENVFTPMVTDRGYTPFNPVGNIAPNQHAPVQFTGMNRYGGVPAYACGGSKKYQEGGEYDLSQAEINAILAMGGQIEYLD